MTAGRFDLSRTDLQRELLDSFGAVFAKECPPEVVRAAEPSGFDRTLWDQLGGLGVLDMVLPGAAESASGRWELALLAGLVGEHLAPVPFVETAAVTRFLAAAGGDVDPGGDGAPVLGLVPAPPDDRDQVVPAGAFADALVARRDDAVVLLRPPPADAAPNLGVQPIARVAPPFGEVVATVVEGPAADAAWHALLVDWRLGLAAALTGAGFRALAIATEQARTRVQFGASIGSYQGVSHRLADVATALDGARLVVDKATWAADRGAAAADALVDMAWCQATRAAEDATTTAVHVLGGYGITEEYDAQLYFRRVKGWALLGGGRRAGLARLADRVLGTGEGGAQ